MARGLERPEAKSYEIHEILTLVENGTIRIPHFQRGQRWGPSDVVKLFDSIYKGYPIGTLLLWKRPAPAAEVTIGTIRFHASQRTDALWIVDGQQRITSLATVLLRVDSSSTTRELYFDLTTERFTWRARYGPRPSHLPVREAHKLNNVLAWLHEHHVEGQLRERVFDLAERLRTYRIPSYTVQPTREGDVAPLREIFDRINTFGKQLTRAEVFTALTSSDIPEGRDLHYLADKIASQRVGRIPDSTLMMCVLSVDGPDVLRDFRSEFANSERLVAAIDRAEAALSRAITFLRKDAGVPHLGLVPYQHLLVSLVRFFALHQDPSEWERVLLRRWYWRAALYGPLPKLGSTGTLRMALKTIDSRSATGTVVALLNEFPVERRRAVAGPMHWSRADTKTTLCAMANLRPLVPTSSNGEDPIEINVASALTNRRSALRRIFERETGESANSPANRVFWKSYPDGAGRGEQLDLDILDKAEDPVSADEAVDPAIVLAASGQRILASHAISESAAEALRRGDAGVFLAQRHGDIQRVVDDFVDARAEWERSTRPALSSL